MNEFDLSSTELNETQNHDDFIVFWNSLDDIPNKLKNFVHSPEEYHSDDICIDDIKKIKSERKIFLVLTDFESLSKFEEFFQIQSIYILQKPHQNIEFNKEDHPKLVNLFQNIDELIDRLRKDIILTYRSDLPISISSLNEITTERSLMNIRGKTLMFLWNQLFIYYLVKSPNIDMKQLKENMLEQCRLEYQTDQIELTKIEDFELNISDNNALKWYTKDSFLHRLLNKSFRTRNIELIYKFQYFIILLYKQFQNLSKEQQQQEEDPSVVYRGQLIDKNTLKKIQNNIGNFISINTFMSTSRCEQVARTFILDAPHAVIFKINLQNQISNSFKSFINISKFSSNQDEEEILFFAGTVFYIDSIEKENNSIWIINLTLDNEISKHVDNIIDQAQIYMKKIPIIQFLFMKTDDFNMIERYYYMLTNETFSSKNSPTVMMYIHLAFAFSNLGFYEKAVELYKKALSVGRTSIDSPESKVLYIIIGYLYYHLSDYNNALNYYGIVLSLLDETNLLISELYNHIGDLQNKMENIDIALSYYKEALKIANYQDILSLPNIYRNIIDILNKQKKFEEAFVYEEQAKYIDQNQYHTLTFDDPKLLEKYEKQLHDGHNLTSIERADLLYKIGLRRMKKGDFEQALIKLLEAKQLIMKEPPSWDRFPRHLSTLFDNIAFLYLISNDYLNALTMWKKGIDIRSNFIVC